MSCFPRVGRVVVVAGLLAALWAAGGCGRGYEIPTIPESLESAGSFDTFGELAALTGLEERLTGPGSITLLAPTDSAFARLPAGRLHYLMLPENRAELRALLEYHLVPVRISRQELRHLDALPTFLGPLVRVRQVGATTLLDDRARLISGDFPATNGVIHAIDAVLIPPETTQE